MIAFAFPYPMLGLSGGAQSLRVETRSGGVGSWCKSTRLYCGKSVGAKTGRVFMCDSQPDSDKGRIQRWFADRKLSAARLRQYGVAAVVSYGLFDAVTYAISLFLAVRAYVAAGKVLTLQAAPQVLLAMWCVGVVIWRVPLPCGYLTAFLTWTNSFFVCLRLSLTRIFAGVSITFRGLYG